MGDAGGPSWSSRAKRTLRQIGPVRLAGTVLFLILGLLSARYSWDIPLARDAERGPYDIRLLETAERVPQDDRIVLVVYTDETLDALAKRSPPNRRILADPQLVRTLGRDKG